MHRVELKEWRENRGGGSCKKVPNAPCGVERLSCMRWRNFAPFVPNAPCGVESYQQGMQALALSPFLMHRVELKVLFRSKMDLSFVLFLMHRVELKDL